MSPSQLTEADPVVIVGLALEAPGGVDTADAYWSLLSDQREGLGHFPTDRGWAVRDLFDGSRRDGFKPIHDLGGFLSDAAAFDPAFFGISPREAVTMDPQQRVALRLAWRALENSGINPDDVAGHDVGCYVGASALEYGPELSEFSNHSGHLITGTSLGVISGRIAYTLDLAGPALTVDTSCSSALTAFHTAVQAVRADDCDMALAGGVCVMGTPGYFVEFSKQHALSDDGHCRPYSALASGTVWAEGAAMFLLQRKSRAQADGRRVLAEVRATVVNQDGRTIGLTAPSGSQQTRLFAKAIDVARVRPEDVGMIEGHGTGTRLGDRTELRALAQTYGATAPGAGALLGSVKSNVGHAQAAAGALGLAKVLVAAQHGAVPATLHVDEVSREIDWEAQGLRVATKQTPWPAVNGHRIAAVSAFGMSGTNAHVVVAMPDDPDSDDTEGRAA
jgi:mycobactin polyketide synthetase MbtC